MDGQLDIRMGGISLRIVGDSPGLTCPVKNVYTTMRFRPIIVC